MSTTSPQAATSKKTAPKKAPAKAAKGVRTPGVKGGPEPRTNKKGSG